MEQGGDELLEAIDVAVIKVIAFCIVPEFRFLHKTGNYHWFLSQGSAFAR